MSWCRVRRCLRSSRSHECLGPAKLWDQAENASTGASEADAEAGGTSGKQQDLVLAGSLFPNAKNQGTHFSYFVVLALGLKESQTPGALMERARAAESRKCQRVASFYCVSSHWRPREPTGPALGFQASATKPHEPVMQQTCAHSR